MDLSKQEVNDIVKRIQMVRTRLMHTHPFFAVLLMHSRFALDDLAVTAYTDGETICFCPDFIKTLNDDELTFVLMHEVMHIALNHCNRRTDGIDETLFNIACDVVVNSNILYSFGMDKSKITLKEYGEAMHTLPNGDEGYKYTVEQVAEILKKTQSSLLGDNSGDSSSSKGSGDKTNNSNTNGDSFDDHSFWINDGEPNDEWKQILVEAKEFEDLKNQLSGQSCGSLPSLLEREIEKYKNPQLNWREILQDFLAQELNDYSFNPPDKRLQDSPFIMPDLNLMTPTGKPNNIWFVVDTSASVDKTQLSDAYYEIASAIAQFDGYLEAKISYFDSEITDPVMFTTEEEFLSNKPVGGGGTDFDLIFKYLKEHMMDDPPVSIVILTDGYCNYPDEKEAMDIPVLWIINNENVTPPWGKVARMETNYEFDNDIKDVINEIKK